MIEKMQKAVALEAKRKVLELQSSFNLEDRDDVSTDIYGKIVKVHNLNVENLPQ